MYQLVIKISSKIKKIKLVRKSFSHFKREAHGCVNFFSLSPFLKYYASFQKNSQDKTGWSMNKTTTTVVYFANHIQRGTNSNPWKFLSILLLKILESIILQEKQMNVSIFSIFIFFKKYYAGFLKNSPDKSGK